MSLSFTNKLLTLHESDAYLALVKEVDFGIRIYQQINNRADSTCWHGLTKFEDTYALG